MPVKYCCDKKLGYSAFVNYVYFHYQKCLYIIWLNLIKHFFFLKKIYLTWSVMMNAQFDFQFVVLTMS